MGKFKHLFVLVENLSFNSPTRRMRLDHLTKVFLRNNAILLSLRLVLNLTSQEKNITVNLENNLTIKLTTK